MKDTELEKLQNLQHATKHRTDALRRCTRVRAVLQGPGRSLAPISKVRAVTVGPAPLSPPRPLVGSAVGDSLPHCPNLSERESYALGMTRETKRGISTPSEARPHCIASPPPPLPCRGSCRGGPPPGRWAGAARTGRARCSRRASPGPPTAAPAAPAPRPLSHDPPQAPPHIPPSGPRPAVPASGYRTRATHSSVRAPPQAAPAGAQRVSRSRTRACQALTSVSLINRLAESASSRPTHPLVWPGHLQAGLITQPSSSRTTPWFGRVIFSSPCVAAPHSGRQSAENIFRAGAAHATGQSHTDRQAETEA